MKKKRQQKTQKQLLTERKQATRKPRIDIGIATYGVAPSVWWGPLMALLCHEVLSGEFEIGEFRVISSALPDFNKNNVLGAPVERGVASPEEKGRNERTDANRSTIVGLGANGKPRGIGFWGSDADYLCMIEDDVLPPRGFIGNMLRLGRPIVSGLVFNGAHPYNPIGYMRREDGLYDALWDYPPGQLQQFDSVGCACVLYHRSVFEKIVETHSLFQRPNGTIAVVHKNDVHGLGPANLKRTEVRDGVLQIPVTPIEDGDNRPWPFFAMEYGRTEDHHFYELAAAAGGDKLKPWIDTSILCEHFKLKGVGRDAHKAVLERMPVEYEQKVDSNDQAKA